MSERRYRIGEIAAQSGVSIATLRYYERRGLLAEPVRSSSGYRAYPAETVATVRLIKTAQALGFSLNEIGILLNLRQSADGSCADAAALTRDKAEEVEERIAALSDNLDALRRLLAACHDHQHKPAGDCPMFQLLASPGDLPKARRAQ